MRDFVFSPMMWAKYGYVDSAVLRAALRLDFFDHLPAAQKGGITAVTLARNLRVSLRGLSTLVEPLTASGVVLPVAETRLALPDELANAFCHPSFHHQLAEAANWWEAAEQMLAAVRTGSPIQHNGKSWDLLAYCHTLFSETTFPPVTIVDRVYDRLARGFWRTQAFICAAELSLFDHLDKGAFSLTQLAKACQTDEKGLSVLLAIFIRLGLIDLIDQRYRYRPQVQEHFLGQGRAAINRAGMQLVAVYWSALGKLDVAVREDQRTLDLYNTEQGDIYHLALARYNTTIFPAYFRLARLLPAILKSVRPLSDLTICDVGAGSGVWGLAAAYHCPSIQVTFLDTPQVLAQTRRNVQRLGLTNQAHFWADDLHTADFGIACFDLIILGQICNTQPPGSLPHLLTRLVHALRPDGYLAIADLILNESRNGPLDYLYFAVKGFVSTPGRVMSLPEYEQLLAAAGLVARHYQLPAMELILAARPHVSLPEQVVKKGVE